MWPRLVVIGATAVASLVAQPPASITALSVSPAEVTLGAGDARVLEVRITGAPALRVRYAFTSGDTTIAVVDSAGRITARATGSTRVVVTARGEAEGHAASRITATVPVMVK